MSHRSPIPFAPGAPPAAAGPIVGERVRILGWFPSVKFVCTCAIDSAPLCVDGEGLIAECPLCHERYALKAFALDPRAGTVQMTITQLPHVPVPAAPPAPTL